MAATFTITDDVRDVLSRSTITADRVVLPPGQLDRKLYERVNKALEGAGGKWNRSAKAHVFTRDPREALGMVAAQGVVTNVKQALQSFYTPDDLAEKLVLTAGLRNTTISDVAASVPLVLEPSIGAGAIALAAIRATLGRMFIDGYDIDKVAIGQARSALEAEFQKRCASGRWSVVEQDFLTVTPPSEPRYDYVLMNPPFTKGQDMAHVLHAWKFLKPGGTLAAITSPGWKHRVQKSAVAFREFIERHKEHVEDLPEGAFKASGTGIATVLVVLSKPE